MFGFIKKCFLELNSIVPMSFFGCCVLNVNSLKRVSMNNQDCKISKC